MGGKMKILIITTHLDYGGIGVYTASLARSMQQRGHEISVASSGGALTGALEAAGIKHIEIDIRTKSEFNPRVVTAIEHLTEIFKKEKPNIMHAQTRVSQVIAGFTSRLTGVPYVSTCHGFFRPHIGRRMFGFWGSRAIAISEAVREHLVNDLKVKKNISRIIYNGVDAAHFAKRLKQDDVQAFKARVGLKDGPVIGSIARLSPVKGHEFLIRAMKSVLDEEPNAQLLIVGDGPCQRELVNLTLELGIGHAVFIENSMPDTLIPLSAMDIFVLPSVQEGLGLALMEAMAASKTVIGSNVGGVYSLIKDGKTGLLVEPKDPEALSAAITRLIKDTNLAKDMGKAARVLIEEKFSLEIMAKNVEEVYEEAIAEK